MIGDILGRHNMSIKKEKHDLKPILGFLGVLRKDQASAHPCSCEYMGGKADGLGLGNVSPEEFQ